MTAEFGSGLHSFLRAHAGKVTGILNGLDTRWWDPATDLELVANFSSGNLSPRSINKGYLQRSELEQSLFLLAMVTHVLRRSRPGYSPFACSCESNGKAHPGCILERVTPVLSSLHVL
jgi:hypothetical protein